MNNDIRTITVHNAGNGSTTILAELIKVSPAGIRYVKVYPDSKPIRFDRQGFEMGNQYSIYSVERLQS